MNSIKVEDSWFYLEPYVYTTVKQNKVLLYNTLDAAYMELDEPQPVALVEQLLDKDSLGVVLLTADMLSAKPIAGFIAELREKFMGDIIPVSSIKEKPLQLVPILNLQNEIERLQKFNENAIGQNVFEYLSELTLYINSACTQYCDHCTWYAKQAKCCSTHTVPDKHTELPLDVIETLLKQNAGRRINITGGNILQCSQWATLAAMLTPYGRSINLWLHYANVTATAEFPATAEASIFVNFPCDEAKLEQCIKKMEGLFASYTFLITNEQEYDEAEALTQRYSLPRTTILPIYVGSNKPFFRQNVFADRDDIFASPLSMKRIFANQSANAKFFGKLYVLPNQDVKASLNSQPLGNLQQVSLLSLIHKELVSGTTWRHVRAEKPCTDCLYQYLCPSPSDYEQVMQQTTMCTVYAES